MLNVFVDLGVIIIIAAIVAFIAKLLKQPLIPSYIVAGILLIPLLRYVPQNIALNSDVVGFISVLSDVGIAFLLFMIGLELDLKKLKDVGPVATVGTLIQFVVCFGLGLFIGQLFHFDFIIGVYFGLLVAFSSTMVVVKLLSDKRELETLHGRILIGIMLMQDVIAVIALTLLQSANSFSVDGFVISLWGGLILIILAWFLGKFVFPKLFAFAAKSQEFLFILSLAVCFIFALLFKISGFSIAIGAFVAGVTLGTLPYSHEISGKIKSLKDFFLLLFFISLGAQFVFSDLRNILWPFVVLVIAIIILKPLVTLIIVSLFGYKKRTSTLTSLSIGQVSEFSIILVAQGVVLGHFEVLGNSMNSLVILTTLVTIALTSYLINYDEQIYAKIAKFTAYFEKLSVRQKELKYMQEDPQHEIVVIGADRMGYSIIKSLKKQQKDFLVVDFNPDLIKKLIEQKVNCIYGDIGDSEIMEHLHLKSVKMVISTIPDMHENLLLLREVKKNNPDAMVILSSTYADDALYLYERGADYVIIPHFLGGEHLSVLLEEKALDIDKLMNTKLDHIRELKIRKEAMKEE